MFFLSSLPCWEASYFFFHSLIAKITTSKRKFKWIYLYSSHFFFNETSNNIKFRFMIEALSEKLRKENYSLLDCAFSSLNFLKKICMSKKWNGKNVVWLKISFAIFLTVRNTQKQISWHVTVLVPVQRLRVCGWNRFPHFRRIFHRHIYSTSNLLIYFTHSLEKSNLPRAFSGRKNCEGKFLMPVRAWWCECFTATAQLCWCFMLGYSLSAFLRFTFHFIQSYRFDRWTVEIFILKV